MSPQLMIALAIALASSATGFATAWKIQDYFIVKKENEYVKQALRATQNAAANAIRRGDNVIVAQNNAQIRERALRNDANSSRAAVVSLSDSANAAVRTAQGDHAACLIAATATSELFIASTDRYRDLAEKADRHVSDIKTLIDVSEK